MRCLGNLLTCLAVFAGTLLLAGCQQQTSSANQQPRNAPSAAPGGAVQNVRQAVKRTADMEDLRNLALAYFQYASLNNRGPSGVEDIKDSLAPKTVEALKDNSVYVVIWNVRNPTTETIIAYAAEPDSAGTRLVARGDASVTRMNEQDFAAVKPKN